MCVIRRARDHWVGCFVRRGWGRCRDRRHWAAVTCGSCCSDARTLHEVFFVHVLFSRGLTLLLGLFFILIYYFGPIACM